MRFAQDSLARILEESSYTHKNEDDSFGVHLDEFKELIDEEDVFDCAEDNGPCPPIQEKAENVEEFCVVSCEDGDITVNHMAYNMIRPGYTVVIYGPRRSGKSHFIRNVCQRVREWYPNVIVFTKTKSSCEYHSYMPDTCIIDGFDEDLLDSILDDQAAKKRAMSRGEDLGNTNILIILDDCMAENMRFKKIFNKIFYNGRHYNTTLLVTMQDVKGIAPAATLNTDICFTFCMPDRRGRDTLREKFADYMTRDQFDSIMDSDAINKKYHMLAFDVGHRYNPLDKRVYFGCADAKAEKKFVMGDKALWQHDKKQLEELGFGHLLQKEDWGIISK